MAEALVHCESCRKRLNFVELKAICCILTDSDLEMDFSCLCTSCAKKFSGISEMLLQKEIGNG